MTNFIFQYTLKNSIGIRHTLITESFLEPGEYITHFGETCLVEDLEVYNPISCEDLHDNFETMAIFA